MLLLIELSAYPFCDEQQLMAWLGDAAEVFVVVPNFGWTPLRNPEPDEGFLARAHSCLDLVLQDLAESGMPADGIVTDSSPVDAMESFLHTFVPSELVVLTRQGPYRDSLEHMLNARPGDMLQLSISRPSM